MLVFIALSCWPFYQIILSQNGIIEGYRVAEEKKLLLQYKGLLEKEKTELDDYIDIKNITLMGCEIPSAVHKQEVVKRNYGYLFINQKNQKT